jgi:hypothetical protein
MSLKKNRGNPLINKEENQTCVSPRGRKACNCINTALMQSTPRGDRNPKGHEDPLKYAAQIPDAHIHPQQMRGRPETTTLNSVLL